EVRNMSSVAYTNIVTSNSTIVTSFYGGDESGSKTLAFTPTCDFNGSISAAHIKRISTNTSNIISYSVSTTTITQKLFGTNYGFGNPFGFIRSSALANTAYGNVTLKRITFGSSNSAYGSQSLESLLDGSQNSAFGTGSLLSLDH